MRGSIQWMVSGEEVLGDLSSFGEIQILHAGMIVHYALTIEMLEGVIAKFESAEILCQPDLSS